MNTSEKVTLTVLVLFGIAISALGGWFVYKKSSSFGWMFEVQQALLIESSAHDTADELYKLATKHAVADKNGDPYRFQTFQHYGNFLTQNSNYGEALALYKQADKYAAEANLKDYRAMFLQSAANAEHYVYIYDDGKCPTLDLIDSAINLKATAIPSADWFPEQCLTTKGQILIDNNRPVEAEKYLDQAHKFFQNLIDKEGTHDKHPQVNPWELKEIGIDQVHCLVDEKKYDKAVDLYHQLCADYPDDKIWLRENFYYYLNATENYFTSLDNQVTALVGEQNYEKLEELAEQLRKKPEEYPDGETNLDIFYRSLRCPSDPNSPKLWKERIASLRKWLISSPKSITARIALAEAQVNQVQFSEAEGYESRIATEQRKHHSEIDNAKKLLTEASQRPPEWYSTMQKVALIQNWDRTRYDTLYSDAQKKYPHFNRFIFVKCEWLLPRWNGKEGELKEFVNTEAGKFKGADRDVFYYQIVDHLYSIVGQEVFTADNLSWDRTKAGLLIQIKRNPTNAYLKTRLLAMADDAHDEEAAKKVFNAKLN